MPIHNADIAAIFDEIADLLEIEAANPFRIRAYRNAARTLEGLADEAWRLVEQSADLTELPGIGKDLAAKIEEIVDSGHCLALDKLRRGSPPGLTELLQIPGLGPKRVHALYHELDIHTPEQLLRAARDGRLRALHGFGVKSEARIVDALTVHLQRAARIGRVEAAAQAGPLVDFLQQAHGVREVTVAGSYRRCRETVGDLDILVSAAHSRPVMERFAAYDRIVERVSQGNTRATVVLRGGLQVDLRVVRAASYGAALHYFTGSRAHNIAIRRRAQQRGLKINEYGVYRDERQIAGATEASVFDAVGLPWIPPELRENRGEIEAAEAGGLPRLVERSDLKGDLHAHTRATDGHDGLGEMAAAARERGLAYLAITDHSRRLTMVHGLTEARLSRQIDEIDRLNARLRGVTLLKGIEVDILEDGALDLPDRVLARLDLVVGAVHSRFGLSRARQTTRILKAMDHPHFTLLAHPSGRLIETREPYDVDMPRIIRHARQRGCFLEINAQPQRLDLTDTYCQVAKEAGVLLSVNSDAHSARDLDNLIHGIGQARRGWLERGDLLNTRSLPQLRKLLRATM